MQFMQGAYCAKLPCAGRFAILRILLFALARRVLSPVSRIVFCAAFRFVRAYLIAKHVEDLACIACNPATVWQPTGAEKVTMRGGNRTRVPAVGSIRPARHVDLGIGPAPSN